MSRVMCVLILICMQSCALSFILRSHTGKPEWFRTFQHSNTLPEFWTISTAVPSSKQLCEWLDSPGTILTNTVTSTTHPLFHTSSTRWRGLVGAPVGMTRRALTQWLNRPSVNSNSECTRMFWTVRSLQCKRSVSPANITPPLKATLVGSIYFNNMVVT